MDTRRSSGKNPEAIVVVNGLGTAVDCNNAFAQLCHTPAGVLVGQELGALAPELAATLDNFSFCADAEEAVVDFGDQSFTLDVEPFDVDEGTGDRVVRLRGVNGQAVA